MSYLALYRKYRPISFDDFVGQVEISNIIKNEILNDKISHAYLFSGPRGTGKTSTAKIIARMINCNNLNENGIPCGKCDSCLNFNSNSDVVEIDAASNNGVDEIRELRDKVNLVPTYGKYKIYIIDEVHMLTTQAFNALLKTLEEPPAHVIFILATTEFHKIPVTVVSRCQKFQFLKFSIDDIVVKLRQIASNESIAVDDDILLEIARLSDGGLRDAINMLDQLSSFKSDKLEIQDVYKLNGVISYVEFKTLLTFIYDNNIVSIVEFIENIDKIGKSFERFIDDFISFLKDILIFMNCGQILYDIKEKSDCVKYLSELYSNDDIYSLIILLSDISIRIKNSSFAKILLISDFIKFSNKFLSCDKKNNDNIDKKQKNHLESNLENSNSVEVKNNKINYKFTDKKDIKFTEKLKKIRINNTFSSASKEYKENFMKNWNFVLEKVANDSSYISIAGMMNDIEVLVVGEKNVIFLAMYDSLLERLLAQVELIEKILFDVFEKYYKVVFLLNDEWDFEREKYINNLRNGNKYTYIEEDNDYSNNSSSDDDINKIVSIFGNNVIKYE